MTNCHKANQGKEAHRDVESILIHYFNTYTHITATKAKPFPNTSSFRASRPSTTRPSRTGISTSPPPTPWALPTKRTATARGHQPAPIGLEHDSLAISAHTRPPSEEEQRLVGKKEEAQLGALCALRFRCARLLLVVKKRGALNILITRCL